MKVGLVSGCAIELWVQGELFDDAPVPLNQEPVPVLITFDHNLPSRLLFFECMERKLLLEHAVRVVAAHMVTEEGFRVSLAEMVSRLPVLTEAVVSPAMDTSPAASYPSMANRRFPYVSGKDLKSYSARMRTRSNRRQ